MEWSGQKEFAASPEVPFTVNDSEAGVLKNYGPLSFLKVSFSCLPTHLVLWKHYITLPSFSFGAKRGQSPIKNII